MGSRYVAVVLPAARRKYETVHRRRRRLSAGSARRDPARDAETDSRNAAFSRYRRLFARRSLRTIRHVSHGPVLPRRQRVGLALVSRVRRIREKPRAETRAGPPLFFPRRYRGEDAQRSDEYGSGEHRIARPVVSDAGNTDDVRTEPRRPFQRCSSPHRQRDRGAGERIKKAR